MLFLLPLVFAGEIEVDPATLPDAVRAAVLARHPDAVIVAASKEKEDGKLVYEAEVTTQGHRVDLSFSADGTWLEEEETVSADALPAPVRDGLARRWSGWTVKRAERATSPGGTTWEVLLAKGKARREVAFADDGAEKHVEGGDAD